VSLNDKQQRGQTAKAQEGSTATTARTIVELFLPPADRLVVFSGVVAFAQYELCAEREIDKDTRRIRCSLLLEAFVLLRRRGEEEHSVPKKSSSSAAVDVAVLAVEYDGGR